MKKIGVLIVSLLVFIMVGCDNGTITPPPPAPLPLSPPTDGRLTITGLENYIGKYIGAYSYGDSYNNYVMNYYAYADVNSSIPTAGEITNDSIILKVWTVDLISSMETGNKYEGFSKNGTITFDVSIYSLPNDRTSLITSEEVTVYFVNGVGNGVFNKN